MKAVTYDDVDAFINRLLMAAAEKERLPERQELESLIRSAGGLLIGAKALAHYVKPRFTEDTDYLVDGKTFRQVRRWFRDRQDRIEYEEGGEAISCENLGIDVIDARNHPVLTEVVRRESVVPCPEALAAIKYCSIVNPLRGRKDQDAVDFRSLAKLDSFDVQKCLSFFVDRFEALRPEIQEAVDKIRRGEPGITI